MSRQVIEHNRVLEFTSGTIPDTTQATITPAPPLDVSARLLADHFSGAHAFHLPWFQRAYAWDDEHAARLLADIVFALRQGKTNYFLGHVLLAGLRQDTRLALIDGHQRTLTLTIIFALLRDCAPTAEDAGRVDRLIREPGFSEIAIATKSGFRLQPQPSISEFVAAFVQQPGSTLREPQDDEITPSETEQIIIENRNRLRSLLSEFTTSPDNWHALTNFLLNSCYLVVERVDDQEEAWSMLALEESTGLPFHSSERLKNSLISAVPRNCQEEANQKWERWQSRLGSDDLTRLMHHVRSLLFERRSNQPLEQDLIKRISATGYEDLFDRHIGPNVENFIALKCGKLGPWRQRSAVAAALTPLHWLERDFWLAPALKWLSINGPQHSETATFFRCLDRLSWLLRISSNDPVQHERHFLRLCREIEPGRKVAQIPALTITDQVRNDAIANLMSRTFFEKKYSRLIMRRIGFELGTDPGEIDGIEATIEHVLPRRPDNDSYWRQQFKSKNAIKDSVHRLGNLAILSLAENQKAGVKPYPEKRYLLRRSKFAPTRQAAAHDAWTPETIEQRTLALTNVLLAAWRLPRVTA
jgi:Protein of unknown function DUF262/Protein of unknown function (DUF1524)